jgi:ribonuclease P protein component
MEAQTRASWQGDAVRWPVADDDGAAGRPARRPARFTRARRLRTAREFADVRRRGRAIHGALLTVVCAAAQGVQPAPDARVGIVVGKRVGNAVTRNRVRRRVREQVRHVLAGTAAGWDIIIIGRPAAAAASSADLRRELADLLRRARVLVVGTEVNGA